MQDVSGLSAKKLKKLSQNAERFGDIYSAINYYTPYADKNSKNATVQFHLAELHEKTRDYQNAAEYYLKAFELDNKNPDAFYRHIVMLKMTGDAELAKEKFNEFNDLIRKNRYPAQWRRVIKEEIQSCDTAIALKNDPLPVEIIHAGPGINGPHAEFSPIPYQGDKMLYGAIKETEIRYFHMDSTTTRRRLYVSEKVGDVWMDAGEWNAPFNSGKSHMVNGSFNKDESMFVFTRCNENWKKEMECGLWISYNSSGGWSEPEKLSELINIPGYIVSQPALAFEPRKELDVLYYASNQAGGQGGMDIWYTYFDKRKKAWRKPRNLGRRLNGEADEITPYYNQREKKLYFSSQSHPGMGGLDVYTSRGELQRFAKPINVGYPVNSSVDELYYVLKNDRESGYFVSNRKGGYQMMNETCCDDIYEFKLSGVIHLAMQGFVMKVNEEDYLTGDGDKLSNQSFNANFLDGVSVELFLIEDSAEVLMDKKTTSADGMYLMDFEPDKQYRVVLSRPGYFSNHIDVDTRNKTVSDTIHQNVGMSEITGESIVIHNILYEFDSSDLTPDAQNKIRTGILNILNENPLIVVEISSHTDDKGDADYNLKLSQQRAESVTKFLSKNGIKSNRLRAKGYGETKPIAANKNADGSDNPDGRAQNRRTEFQIVGELEKPVEVEEEDEEE